jgi:hypothetical protein
MSFRWAPAGEALSGSELLADAGLLIRLLISLPGFLRDTVSPARGIPEVRDRVSRRDEAFLRMLGTRVYSVASSPYRALLDAADIDLATIERWVARETLTGALQELAGRGVYVSFDEFKGRRSAIRGTRVFRFRERDFDNPLQAGHFEIRSGGTRGPATRVLIDLAYLRARAATTALLFEAQDLWTRTHALWLPPGSGSLVNLFALAKVGAVPVRWFSQLPLARLGSRARLVTRLVGVEARAVMRGWPQPEVVSFGEAGMVVRWLTGELASGRRPCLWTFASSAVRVCDAALRQGSGLTGACFVMLSEPVTRARRQAIEATGAQAIVHYGFTEGGVVGYGCPSGTQADDVHLLEDLVACVQRPRPVGTDGATVAAYCFTSLLPAAPKILLNTEPGDYGNLWEGTCGCAFERAGMRVHLSEVRSFEKLTGEGMTFAGSGLLGVLEETLPAGFGGRPIDYQLLEEEAPDGLSWLSLVIDASVGPVDERAVRDQFFDALQDSFGSRLATEVWREAGRFRVLRRAPITTPLGKVLPFEYRRIVRDGVTSTSRPGARDPTLPTVSGAP